MSTGNFGPNAMLRRTALACLYAFVCSIPFDVWNVSEVGSLASLVGLGLVAVGGLAVLARGTVRPIAPSLGCLLFFVLWVAASAAWSVEPEATGQRVATYAQLSVFMWMFWQLARGERELRGALMAYVLGAMIASAGTIASYVQGQSYEEARYALAGYDPNDLGLTLALAIPMAWMLALRETGMRRRLGVLYMPLAVTGVALTASRGAMLATLVALLIIPATVGSLGRRGRIAIMAVGIIASVLLVSLVPETSWERLLAAREQIASGTMTNRTTIWAAGWEVLKSNWVAGVGAGGFAKAVQPVLGTAMAAHNTFLSVATETGVVGLSLFLAPFGALLVRGWRAEGQRKSFVLALMGTWAVGVSSLTWEYRKSTWFLLAVVAQALAAHAYPYVQHANAAISKRLGAPGGSGRTA